MFDSPLKIVTSVRSKKRDKSISRLGIAVSKKYSKSAVKRNHAKRLLRESFRHSDIKFIGLDLLVILSKPVSGISKKEVSNIIYSKFKNLEGRILWAQTKKER